MPHKKTVVYSEMGFLQGWSIKMGLHWRRVCLTQCSGIVEMANVNVTEGAWDGRFRKIIGMMFL